MTQMQGYHHVALFTGDLDQTIRFWTSVMGARLVRTARDTDGDPGARHYYFDIGGTLLAFFEFPAQNKEALNFGWLHHVALKVESLDALEARRAHIEGCGVQVSGIRNHDFVSSIYLHDPNGILIELAVQTRELTEEDFTKDPQPVAAVKEMLA